MKTDLFPRKTVPLSLYRTFQMEWWEWETDPDNEFTGKQKYGLHLRVHKPPKGSPFGGSICFYIMILFLTTIVSL